MQFGLSFSHNFRGLDLALGPNLFKCIQKASEYRTSLVFKWLKPGCGMVRFSDVASKNWTQWSGFWMVAWKLDQKCMNLLKLDHCGPVFKWWYHLKTGQINMSGCWMSGFLVSGIWMFTVVCLCLVNISLFHLRAICLLFLESTYTIWFTFECLCGGSILLKICNFKIVSAAFF